MSFELDTLSYTLLGSIFGAAALLSVRNARGPDIHPLLLNTQSDVSRVRYPGSTAVYRSRMYPNGSPLLTTSDRSLRTLQDWYLSALDKFRAKTFIGERSGSFYAWHNYESIEKKSKAYFSGLVNIAGLTPSSGAESSFVGIFSPNTADTLAIEIGCQCGGLVTIPISQDATPSHVSHVLENSGLNVLVVHTALLDRVTAIAAGNNLLHVKHIVIIGGTSATSGSLSKLEASGFKVHQIADIERNGAENPVSFGELQNSNIASIYYTSTNLSDGKPGVILTHKNLLSVAASYAMIIPPAQRFTPKDRVMHNLPIDNVYGRVLTLLACACGSSLVYGEIAGEDIDTATALSNAAEAKPTVFASGFAFWDQVKDLVEARYGNSFLFRRGLDKKKAYFEEGRLVNDSKYDMLVFRDIRQKLFGGNLRLVLVDYNDEHKSNVAEFLRAVLGTQVLQAFNRPETCSTVSLSMLFDYRADPAAFGAPLPCNELKLEDLPDRGYTADDKPNPRGEICVRGNNVFAGYWNDDVATERVKDADGWFMTSIVGEMLPNGTLKILGLK
ncbi:hypothetical protein VTP01DRAFT_10227 [Rhizomucor pusillus]|uniref:uncharacterized protein n=1 Tax=Rhizomucor pusillus TaxID=4840 RepID=UPI0037424844